MNYILYVERLLRHLSLEPPPAYQSVTLSQVIRADKEVFTFLAHNVTDIRPDALDVRPLDNALDAALKDYNTAFHLLPLPKAHVQEPAPKRTFAEPYPTFGGHKGRGKGKGSKGHKSFGSNAAPRGYSGCVGRDGKNRPICFDYNLSQCSKAPAGGACAKGRHVCFKAGCFKTHPFKEGHADEAAGSQRMTTRLGC